MKKPTKRVSYQETRKCRKLGEFDEKTKGEKEDGNKHKSD